MWEDYLWRGYNNSEKKKIKICYKEHINIYILKKNQIKIQHVRISDKFENLIGAGKISRNSTINRVSYFMYSIF